MWLADHLAMLMAASAFAGFAVNLIWSGRALERERMAGIQTGEQRGFEAAVKWLASKPERALEAISENTSTNGRRQMQKEIIGALSAVGTGIVAASSLIATHAPVALIVGTFLGTTFKALSDVWGESPNAQYRQLGADAAKAAKAVQTIEPLAPVPIATHPVPPAGLN